VCPRKRGEMREEERKEGEGVRGGGRYYIT